MLLLLLQLKDYAADYIATTAYIAPTIGFDTLHTAAAATATATTAAATSGTDYTKAKGQQLALPNIARANFADNMPRDPCLQPSDSTPGSAAMIAATADNTATDKSSKKSLN